MLCIISEEDKELNKAITFEDRDYKESLNIIPEDKEPPDILLKDRDCEKPADIPINKNDEVKTIIDN